MLELPPDQYRELVQQIARAMAGAAAPAPPEGAALAAAIEHTLLAPDATAAQIAALCGQAGRWGCAAVCVNPSRVAQAAALLRGSSVRVVTVAGFPLGAGLPSALRAEAAACLRLGADELDVVIALGALKDGDDARVQADLGAVTALAHQAGAQVKAILELALLTPQEKVRACGVALAAGVDFVKTSTGFAAAGGATVEDVALLRALAGGRAGIKAAGGIRTRAQAEALLAAGASRLGTSHTADILGHC